MLEADGELASVGTDEAEGLAMTEGTGLGDDEAGDRLGEADDVGVAEGEADSDALGEFDGEGVVEGDDEGDWVGVTLGVTPWGR